MRICEKKSNDQPQQRNTCYITDNDALMHRRDIELILCQMNLLIRIFSCFKNFTKIPYQLSPLHNKSILKLTSSAIALFDDCLSLLQSDVVAVATLKVEFNSTFELSPKTGRMAANRWSAMYSKQRDCNGGRSLLCLTETLY